MSKPSRVVVVRRFASAFTLLELLVVIAVLAVLLAILMPSLQRARHLGRLTVCQTRLRTLYGAAIEYAADNRHRVPRLKRAVGSLKYSYSDDMIRYLLPDNHTVDADRNGKLDDDVQKLTGVPLFRCPSAAPAARIRSYDGRQVLDYGYNHYGHDNAAITPHKDHWPTMSGRRITEVANPAVVFMADAEADASPEDIGGLSRTAGTMQWPLRESFQNHAYLRHLDGHNAVQFDGAGTHYSGVTPQNDKWFIRKP